MCPQSDLWVWAEGVCHTPPFHVETAAGVATQSAALQTTGNTTSKWTTDVDRKAESRKPLEGSIGLLNIGVDKTQKALTMQDKIANQTLQKVKPSTPLFKGKARQRWERYPVRVCPCTYPRTCTH